MIELEAIAFANRSREALQVIRNPVENAAIFGETSGSLAGIGGVADQPFEDRARPVFRRERRRRGTPHDGVVVHAAVSGFARANESRLQSHLERGKLSLFAEFSGPNLICGDTTADVGARCHFRMRAGQISAACARVVTVDFEFEFASLIVGEPAENQHAIFESSERLQDRGELESAADGRRRPLVHDDSIGHGEERKALRCFRRGFGRRAEGRKHGVEHG